MRSGVMILWNLIDDMDPARYTPVGVLMHMAYVVYDYRLSTYYTL
jgi:hypothetical protein